jgi:NADH:ubiquinone oxidoreductase subunit B-like Fe-S oxidoreductase
MQIVPAGVVGTLLKESVQQRRNEFLQLTSNPVDIQILGAAGRAELLREAAKNLNMDIDKLIPDPDDIRKQQAEQQQMMQMQQMQQMQQGQPQQGEGL